MSDLIDRQAAIDALERLKKDISGDYTNFDPLVMAGTAYIGDCIGELLDLQPSAEKQGRWIPVTERLPEHNEDVLISCGPIVEAGWYNEIDGAWCAEGCSSLPVTAWMPMPEPWREEE